MTVNIRRMKSSDIETVYLIETDVHIAPWSKDIIRDCVLVGYDCRVLEIYNGQKVLLGGYIITRHSENTAHILNFCIAKSIQSKGYGRILLHDVLNSLLNTHIEHVILVVRPSNVSALHLYETMGFNQVEIKKEYYKDGDRIEDAILLKKIIKPINPN